MTTYNERLINTYNVTELKNLLSNPELYRKAIQEKINRFNPNQPSRCSIIAPLDALDNFIVKCLLENPKELERNSVIIYRNNLFETFKTHPLMVMDSLLFRDDIYPLLFDTNQTNQIKTFKEKLKKEIKDIVKKVNNNEPITEKMHNEYLLFLIEQLENNNPKVIIMVENYIGKLLSSPNKKSLLEKEFILKYVASKVAKENNIPPVQIYISDDHYNGKTYSENENGCSYGNTSIISVNRNNIINEVQTYKDIDPLVKAMQTIAHETKHSIQAYESSKGIPSYSSIEYARFLLFSKYLSKENFNEYMANYRHSEIERDANIYGWTFVTKLLEKFNPNLINNIENTITQGIKTQYEMALGNKQNGQKRKPKEDYNVHYLDEIIQTHPHELHNFPQLQSIYNPDGSRKDIISLIDSEEQLYKTKDGNKLQDVFEEYYYFDISKGLLNDLNIESYSEENQFKIIDRICKTLRSEITNVSRTIQILTTQNLPEFEHINAVRISRIVELINFINNKSELINQLISKDIANNNQHMLGMSFQMTSKLLLNLQKKIKDKQCLSETSIYNELIALSEVEYYGHKF